MEEYFGVEKGELDLLSGGAPCQSFSYAGKRLGLEDARGTLFYHYAKFLDQLQPKMFLFENVRGLLTHDKGRTYKTIVDIFESTGYTIQKQVLNAWDYGVAQKRERLITIGIRNDLTDKIHFDFPVPHKYKPVLRDILLDCPKSEGSLYSEYKRKIFELVPPGGYWKDIPEDVAKEYMKSCWDMEGGRTGILRRLSLDEPSLTVLTSPSQKQTDRCHPLEPRPFTIRENARCQSFPDDWQFCGSVGQQYKQVGNAVPVNLAYDIAQKCLPDYSSYHACSLVGQGTQGKISFMSPFFTTVQTLLFFSENGKTSDIKKLNVNLKQISADVQSLTTSGSLKDLDKQVEEIKNQLVKVQETARQILPSEDSFINRFENFTNKPMCKENIKANTIGSILFTISNIQKLGGLADDAFFVCQDPNARSPKTAKINLSQ